MTNREINNLVRDGGRGRNVYVVREDVTIGRVTAARTRRGIRQVRLLISGQWMHVLASDAFEIR